MSKFIQRENNSSVPVVVFVRAAKNEFRKMQIKRRLGEIKRLFGEEPSVDREEHRKSKEVQWTLIQPNLCPDG